MLREWRLDVVHLVASKVDLTDALEVQVATDILLSAISHDTASTRKADVEELAGLEHGPGFFVDDPLRFLGSGGFVCSSGSSGSCSARTSACLRSSMASLCASTRFSATNSMFSRIISELILFDCQHQ